nr:receptor like protein 22-like [Lolium perenne]
MYRKGAFLNLETLELCCNSLSGQIPSFLFSLPRLKFISLMSNNFEGPIQEFSYPSPSLASIYLNYNQLNGSVPKSFFSLTSLQTLQLSRNGLSGTVQLTSFWRLTNISNLILSANTLTVVVDDEDYFNSSPSAIVPPINSLGLACCNMTKVPSILKYVLVKDLDLSCNQIGGSVPKWIWAGRNENVDVFKFNLSRNKFTGMELSLANASVYFLDLSFNSLPGPIPVPISPQFLDYSNNQFSSIPQDLMPRLSSSFYLNMANNTLHGGIPPMICDSRNLELLDLSYNHFSGHVPSCLVDGYLTILNLGHNHFQGTLPDDIQRGCASQTIDLNGNQLEGLLPRSLSNCHHLEVFDVGGNNFADSFPDWLGNLTKLRVLVLRSNKLFGPVGTVPTNSHQNRTHFQSLQIIDLASNSFSGSLHSQWFEELKAMMDIRENDDGRQALEDNLSGKFYRDTVVVTYKGIARKFTRILTAFTVIDFSANAFTGSIPESMGELASLRGLNMSHNAFTGTIPPKLGHLTQLESLDLSSNQLHGAIPEVLASLNSLAWLNVSSNQLEGAIPQRGQFLTFTIDSFQGNAGLCGEPLSKQCNSGVPSSEHDKNSDDRVDTIVLYLVAGSGYGLGLAVAILFQVAGKRWSLNRRVMY